MILTTLAALWTFSCSGFVCRFDATSSTGTIRSYNWTFSDSTKASGVIVGHTFTHAGTFSVTLKVYDGLKYSQLTKKITVTAANVITRVDTVRIPSKPDTIRLTRVDTLIRHDTVLYAIPGAASFGYPYAADTSRVQGAPVGRVWRMELVGTIDTLGRRFRMFSAPTVLTTGPMTLTALSVYGTAENLTSAITLLVRADSARRAGP